MRAQRAERIQEGTLWVEISTPFKNSLYATHSDRDKIIKLPFFYVLYRVFSIGRVVRLIKK